MRDKLAAAARELVQTYGVSLLDDPERLGQLLEGECGSEYRREIFILSFALREILKKEGGVPSDAELENCMDGTVSRLHDNLGFSRDDALWAAGAILEILSGGSDDGRRDQRDQIEARRGFLEDMERVNEMPKHPRTASQRKKAFRNGFLLTGITILFFLLFVRITDSYITLTDEHRILFLGHLSGQGAAAWHVSLKGSQLAADQINALGGVKSRPIHLYAHDISRNPDTAAESLSELLRSGGVTAIISACGGEVNAAMAKVADTRETPLIVTKSGLIAATMEAQDRPWLYSFRISCDNNYLGEAIAYFLSQGLKIGRGVSLIRDIRKSAAETAASFEEAFRQSGGDLLYSAASGAQDGIRASDASEMISRRSEAVIMIDVSGGSAARSGGLLRELGYKGYIIEALGEDNTGEGDGKWRITSASPDDPQLQSFKTSYLDKYNEQIPEDDFVGAVLAYDAVIWLADAIYRAPGFQGEALRHALLSTRNLALTHATLTIDPRTHSPWNKALALAYRKGGAWKFQKRFRPK
ncbi:branched-chain amino acid ABC transporter substrate-binding protein [Synergistales bacterium]|nr:branched-chain amino acid ABC transporter substrate-binding protein [Synergistales bacterium]